MYEGSTVCFFRAEFLHDVCPDLAGCTQFSDFHEEVSALVEFEGDSLGNIVDIQTAFHHLAYIFNRYRIGVGNFLNAFRSAQGEHGTANQDGAQAGSVFLRPFDNAGHLVIQGIQTFSGLAVLYQFADRVGTDNTVQLFNLFAGSFQSGYRHCQQAGRAFAGIQHIRQFFQIQPVQHGVHVFQCGQAYALITGFFSIFYVNAGQGCAVNANMVNRAAFGNFKFQQFVVFLRFGEIACLRDTPGFVNVSIHRAPAQVVTHARIIIRRQDVFPFTQRVNGVEGNAFIVFGVHHLVKRLAF